MPKYDIIIAGSGLGGLICGYILAKEGLHVCILEKNKKPGGCLRTFTRKGVVFDTGVHYFGAMDSGQTLNRYWSYFGLTQSLKMERMNPDGFDIIGFKGKDYPLAIGFDHFVEELLSFFPNEKENLERYTRCLKEISRDFSLYNLETPKDHSEENYRDKSAFTFFSSISKNTTLPSVLAGNNLLYAGNRESTPLYIPALINHSFISSAWRTVDGSDQIANILVESIKHFGGDIFLEEEINRIEKENEYYRVNSKSGNSFSSGKFISGIHPSKTLKMMNPFLFRKAFINRITNLKDTSSSFAIYIVFKNNSFPFLNYNYYHHETETVWNDDNFEKWPQNYMIHTPAHSSESSFAKNMIILTSMPFGMVKKWENTRQGNRGEEYLEFKDHCTKSLLNLVSQKFPELTSSISYIESSTPLTWRDYNGVPEGSMYGIQHDYREPLITMLLPATKIPEFYFTGQNINIHGVLGVTIGAVLTCGEILGLEYLLKKIRTV
ncbi:MAG: NAD(P)/FAD-dependent oxidoreductase [Bacteroidales bacterium]